MVAAKLADMPAHRPASDNTENLQTSLADAAQTSGLENGRSTAHIRRMEETPAIVGAIIALVAIYPLWALRGRR